MHKLESVLENKAHKIPWNFEKIIDHPISAKRPNLVLINKRMSSIEICCSGGSQIKTKRKWKDRQILGFCQRAEKAMEHEGDSDTDNS